MNPLFCFKNIKILLIRDKGIVIERLIEKAEQYGKSTAELYKLKAIDKVTDVFASLASRIVIFSVLALFILLITVGLAFYFGELLGAVYYGFFTLAGIYAFIAIILLLIRTPLENMFNNYIINQIFKEKNDASN